MKFVPSLAFDLAPSRTLAGALAAMTLLAAVAPWPTALPTPLRVALSVFALASGVRALLRQRQRPFRRAAWRPSGWTLIDTAGREHAALLDAHVRVGALLGLDFRHGRAARYRALLLPDNLDADSRRRLIVLLARAEVVRAE